MSADELIQSKKNERRESMRGLVTQIKHYSIAVAIPALISLLSSAIFTRLFEINEYGIYASVFSIVGIVTTVLSQLFKQPIVRYASGGKEEEIEKILTLTFYGLILVSVLITTVILLLFNNKFFLDYREYLIPSGIFGILSITFSIMSAILQSQLQSAYYSKIEVLNNVFKFIFSVLFAFSLSKSPVALLWGAIAAWMLLFFPLLRRLKSDVVLTVRVKMYKVKELLHSSRKMLMYGTPMMIWFLASSVLSISDRIIINIFRGSEEVGIYSASYNLVSGTIGLISMPVSIAAYPFLMSAWSKGHKGEVVHWLGTVSAMILSSGIVLLGGCWLFYVDIAEIFLGENFRVGSSIMPVALAGMVFMSFAHYAHKPFEFYEKTTNIMLLIIFIALINIILNVLLVPFFGYKIAAWTTLICYFLYSIFGYLSGRKLLNWSVKWKLPVVTLCSAVFAIAVVKLISYYFVIENVFLHLLLGISFYTLVCLIPLAMIYKKQILVTMRKRIKG
ncbi:oligosaccharide flippase family protein [Paenibacillus filicis]|uniref:Oligosaccharide flippase family protein n=1 Tax=Paenibacillus filicis TaxID=669464 RepID=A0ABU9DDH5_9BACL